VTAVAENQGQMMSAFEQNKGLTAMDVLRKSQVHERLLECVAAAFDKSQDEGTAQSGFAPQRLAGTKARNGRLWRQVYKFMRKELR
jgi:hypothetical protein